MALKILSISEAYERYVSSLRAGYLKYKGYSPNLEKGSHNDIEAETLANIIFSVGANTEAVVDELFWDTATGVDLDKKAEMFGISRRPAGKSSGYVIFQTSITTKVMTGAILSDAFGNKLAVVNGGTYKDGDKILVNSVLTGEGANIAPGTTITWSTPPVYASKNCIVDDLGITNGVDEETDQSLRDRIIYLLANPAASGNPPYIIKLATNSVAEVESAYVYPAPEGKSTCHVALIGTAKASQNRQRVISDQALANVTSLLTNDLTLSAVYTVTKITPQTVDISFGITIPNSSFASVPGDDTGWIDATVLTPVSKYVNVTAVTSSTNITISSSVNPVVGNTIQWVSYSEKFNLYTAKILTVATTGTSHVITLDSPFVGIVTGDYVFSGTVLTQTLVDSVLTSFAILGPGEKTNDSEYLPRALRRPKMTESNPANIDSKFLQNLVTSSQSVLDTSFLSINDVVQTSMSCPVSLVSAGSISAPPVLLTPKRIGFYPIS
jgi:hypothetical protein